MARVSGLKTKLSRHNIADTLAKEIIGNGDLVDIAIRMETLLDPDTVYQILDASACGTSKKELNGIKRIAADSLQERIDAMAHVGDFHAGWNVRLSNDDTITAGWTIQEKGAYACVCSAAVNKKQKVSDLAHGDRVMPLTYCFCCAGHCRRHLEKLLGVGLKTKEVVSSPIHSGGQKPCAFIFEIMRP